jgi:tRNA U55 pseudouridine synthase TruB
MITAYKPIGISCLDLIKIFKEKDEYKDKKMGISGRLDEMAHGVVTILIDEETKNIEKYHKMNKVYRFRFIVGLETDTTAVLGFLQNKQNCDKVDIDLIKKTILDSNSTQFLQDFHIYSSFCVRLGDTKKPLWWWAKSNRLDEIADKMPKKSVNIYDISVLNIKNITLDEFISESLENLSKVVKGNFRQDEIIDQWKKYYSETDKTTIFPEFECEIKVSSGFYIRQFVKDIGKLLNINVLVTEIERLRYFN